MEPRRKRKSLVTECLTEVLILALVVAPVGPARAQQQPLINGSETGIPTADGFLFEPEVPFTSLKHVPTWSELEQLLDNPYLYAHDPSTPGNDQGFPSYRSRINRRPGFLPGGAQLPQFLIHPPNYNPLTGEEMRLINPFFPATRFNVIDVLDPDPAQAVVGTYTWRTVPTVISAGRDRVEPGSIPIDYNNPIGRDRTVCVNVTEVNPPEGSVICGGDPGEPGYAGFGVLRPVTNYSTPGVPLSLLLPPAADTGFVLNPAQHRLFDPQRLLPPDGMAGFILPRNSSGAFGLRKPSLRVPQVEDMNGNPGSPARPAYTANVDPDEVTPSNENDFIRSQAMARVLGKALFWDMQVGSDGVQSCGTCHFNGTGTDSRTKNQLNPNHLGGDNKLDVGDAVLGPNLGKAANYELKAADFPLHKVADPDVAGDPACATPLTADVSAVPYDPQQAGYRDSQRFSNPQTGVKTVCSAGNIQSDVNDVVSSMGVHWGIFKDIAPIGALIDDPSGVRIVKPDLRETEGDCAGAKSPAECIAAISDPIPAFAGAAGTGETGIKNEFRRVEPRNTPTMQAASFNFDNFWDGRARHDFNGGSVFGAGDPQSHVFVCGNTNPSGESCTGSSLVATRQIIRFTSIASLATGPALSEFEMSFFGRNWPKLGKKLLQPVQADTPAPGAARGAVTPLANQLVDLTDSLLGPYSNQGGSACRTVPTADRSPGNPAPGKPGLCISYLGLIRQSFYPALWGRSGRHLNGCYTDGRSEIHTQCGTLGTPAASVRVLNHDATKGPLETVIPINADPFDGYVLSIANDNNPAVRGNTNQFTQMEANFSLFWGLAVNAWIQILVPDDTPFDQFLDGNPDAFGSLGEPGEFGLVSDLPNCTTPFQRIAPTPGNPMGACFTEVGNFRRDDIEGGLTALLNATGEGGGNPVQLRVRGTRKEGDADPLLGLDLFFASNLSLKNPNFRTGRCGECHAIPTLTDHTMPFTSKINLMDAVAEFATPGVELILEPLARLRVISGFLLESEIVENGQDAVERRIVDQSIVPNPVDGLAYPGATPAGLVSNDGTNWGPWTGADSAFLDNGMYNLGIRPISEDLGRGGNDAFGWPLSLAALMMKNLGGEDYNPGGDDPSTGFAQPAYPGNLISTVDPEDLESAFEPNAQDPQINPGFEGEPANPMIPSYIGDFANNLTVGDFPPEVDEAGGAIGGMVNVLTDLAMIEGFMDTLGPFNPGNTSAEVLNYGGMSERAGDVKAQMGTWPNVNRVGRMGSFKAAPLRNVELTGPYFHNGGKLTLRQVVDFYTRGGDFPVTNSPHRDFNLVNMNIEIQSNLSEEEKVALVDFLLELTDERNRFARAPFDKPQVIVPVDGLAPDNTAGRAALLSNTAQFMDVVAVGAGGTAAPEPAFMNLTNVRVSGPAAFQGPECDFDGSAKTGRVSQYCH